MPKPRVFCPDLVLVRSLLDYNKETGIFTWTKLAQRSVRHKRAGSPMPSGYRRIKIDGFEWYEHRLALYWVTGIWPLELVDHRNLIKSDNRFTNLRHANSALNSQNSKVGKPYWNGSKWVAQLTHESQTIHIGVYSCFGQALKARNAKKRELHPEAENFRK